MQNSFRFYRSNEGNFKIKTKHFNCIGNRENSDILIKFWQKSSRDFDSYNTYLQWSVLCKVQEKCTIYMY